MTCRVLLVTMLAVVGACARAPASSNVSPQDCTGKLYLDVHNPLLLAVDIYEGERTRRDAAQHIGNAPPGDTRLPISHPILRMFAVDANGQGLTMEPSATTIRVQTLCIQ